MRMCEAPRPRWCGASGWQRAPRRRDLAAAPAGPQPLARPPHRAGEASLGRAVRAGLEELRVPGLLDRLSEPEPLEAGEPARVILGELALDGPHVSRRPRRDGVGHGAAEEFVDAPDRPRREGFGDSALADFFAAPDHPVGLESIALLLQPTLVHA